MNSVLEKLATALDAPPPWLLPYVPIARTVVAAAGSASVAGALNAVATEAPVRFVDQSSLSLDEAYEAFIARTGCVPTRDNLHDLFNGLVWLSYPQAKARLNRLQAKEISERGITSSRGPLRDALTLFDENAALMHAPAMLVDALRRRDWRALFIEHRDHWRSARVQLFGHALLEKLMQPRKAITAHVWIVENLSDEVVASSIEPDRLVAKAFLPLPVLGVPGWCSANEAAEFYADAEVFRPLR
ncbi:MAG TPA: DUF3025 domain-containing protein [Steroidobacteraceae bacterium]|nr:DUF3025 domain-containing protein [Steroidobacteraceae bacterium]